MADFEIEITRKLWDAETGTMVDRQFVVVIDLARLKPPIFHKARKNKGGKAQVLNGALVIRPKD